MDKRSYFSHRFLNEVSHTGVNLDNPENCRWVGGVQIELSRWAPDRDKVPEKIKFVTQWFCMSICGCDSCAQNPTVLGPFGPGLQATGPPLDLQVCQTSACPMWQKLKNTLSNFHVCTLALFHSFKIQLFHNFKLSHVHSFVFSLFCSCRLIHPFKFSQFHTFTTFTLLYFWKI